MTPLRKKRLLYLATTPNAWHQKWYSYYCQLQTEGLTGWCFGFAFLTDKGKQELQRLINN